MTFASHRSDDVSSSSFTTTTNTTSTSSQQQQQQDDNPSSIQYPLNLPSRGDGIRYQLGGVVASMGQPYEMMRDNNITSSSTTNHNVTTTAASTSPAHISLILKTSEVIRREIETAYNGVVMADTVSDISHERPRKRRRIGSEKNAEERESSTESQRESSASASSPQLHNISDSADILFQSLCDCLKMCDSVSKWNTDWDVLKEHQGRAVASETTTTTTATTTTNNDASDSHINSLWMSLAAFNGIAKHEINQLLQEAPETQQHYPTPYSERQLARMNDYYYPASKLPMQRYQRPLDSLTLMSTSFKRNTLSDHEEYSLLRNTPLETMQASTKFPNLELYTIHARGRSSAWYDMKQVLDRTLPHFDDLEKFIIGTHIRSTHTTAADLDSHEDDFLLRLQQMEAARMQLLAEGEATEEKLQSENVMMQVEEQASTLEQATTPTADDAPPPPQSDSEHDSSASPVKKKKKKKSKKKKSKKRKNRSDE